MIQLVIAYEGRLDPDQLLDALERCTAANPGSSLRLEQRGAEPLWVVGPPPPLTVIEEPGWSGDREGPDFLRWPLSSYEGPSCELVLVRGAAHDHLVFRALHSVMDGRGTLAWAEDLLRSLRGEVPLGHTSALTIEELMPRDEGAKRPAPRGDALPVFGPADLGSPGLFPWRRFVLAQPLDAAATGRIAVALAQQARQHAEGVVRLNLPTDLRHLRPGERTTGNLFGSLFIEIPPEATAELVGLKIMQLLYKKEGSKQVGMYAAYGQVGSLAAHRVKALWDLEHLHDTGRYPFSVTLSHLGALRSEALSAPGVRATGAYFVPLIGETSCVLSLNGFDDRTEVAVGLSDRFGAQVERLAERVRGAIVGA